jgi:hypothetical protein
MVSPTPPNKDTESIYPSVSMQVNKTKYSDWTNTHTWSTTKKIIVFIAGFIFAPIGIVVYLKIRSDNQRRVSLHEGSSEVSRPLLATGILRGTYSKETVSEESLVTGSRDVGDETFKLLTESQDNILSECEMENDPKFTDVSTSVGLPSSLVSTPVPRETNKTSNELTVVMPENAIHLTESKAAVDSIAFLKEEPVIESAKDEIKTSENTSISNIKPFDALKSNWSHDKFVSHNMFKYTNEKEDVFQSIMQRVDDVQFQQHYNDFLQDIQKDNWFENYTKDAVDLGYLSLMAYLDGKIDQDDLTTLQLIANAIQENQEDGNIQGFSISVETSQTISDTLKDAHYPPFGEAQKGKEPLIGTYKPPVELEKVKEEFVAAFDKKSPLKRTVLSYNFSYEKMKFNNGRCLNKNSVCLHEVLYKNSRSNLGIKSIIEEGAVAKGTYVMVPLAMSYTLGRQLVNHETKTFSEQIVMFGYGEDAFTNETFQAGKRVVSIGSPLFKIPPVHNSVKGPLGLQCTAHDVYHLYLDIGNPYLTEMLDLQKALVQKGEDKMLIKFAELLLDREVYFPNDNYKFDHGLTRCLNTFLLVTPEKEFPDHWVTDILLPFLEETLKDRPYWNRKDFIGKMCNMTAFGKVRLF